MSAALIIDDLTLVHPGGGGIRDVSFTAQDRGLTAVIGANGAGKTVLFTLIAGLASPQSGTIRFPGSGATVAYCPDVPQFEGWLTATEVVTTSAHTASTRGTRANAARQARDALDACGLAAVSHRRVADFSRGMLQRLGIAAALVTDPDILILDEPNSALDPIGRADVRELILDQRQRRCILLSSHLLSEVEALADHVITLDQGRVVAQGRPSELLGAGLEPVWTIRLTDPTELDLAELAGRVPQARFESDGSETCHVRFESFDAARDHLLAAVLALDTPVIEVTLRDRDLDAAFARLVRTVNV